MTWTFSVAFNYLSERLRASHWKGLGNISTTYLATSFISSPSVFVGCRPQLRSKLFRACTDILKPLRVCAVITGCLRCFEVAFSQKTHVYCLYGTLILHFLLSFCSAGECDHVHPCLQSSEGYKILFYPLWLPYFCVSRWLTVDKSPGAHWDRLSLHIVRAHQRVLIVT